MQGKRIGDDRDDGDTIDDDQHHDSRRALTAGCSAGIHRGSSIDVCGDRDHGIGGSGLRCHRQNSVRDWLRTKGGLANFAFDTRGFGATQPVAPNQKPDSIDDPDGRQKNRRVEITIKT